MDSIDIQSIRDNIKNFRFEKLFIENLGWEYPKDQSPRSITVDKKELTYSELAKINSVPVLLFNSVPLAENKQKEKIHKKIKEFYNKHLILLDNNKVNSFAISYLSKENKVRTHSYFRDQSEDNLISKLSSIHFDIEDEPKIVDIGQRLDTAFNTEKITKQFYEDFKNNHFSFQNYISGISNEEDKKWYTSVVLNRLMFIWFLQKKLFVNNDASYLETKLKESNKKGKNKYYSEFLKLLFFEGFAKRPKERSEKARQVLGQIDYLNGGLFVPHPIEDKYGDKINIKDEAFEKTYEIFQNYEWHIKDQKGQRNEVSPDVLGYIFEKYINELQQKNFGAYYTRDEITDYLSRNTIDKFILDKINDTGHQFKTIEEMLLKLDVDLCKKLLTDENSVLNTLTILDPAVGSGAFLISAMKRLIDIYSPIIGKIKILGNRDLTVWLEDFEKSHKSIAYGIKKNIILKNLYGVDIMKEAAEVCKLRLFLSLVASALERRELEPLPNIDFNIMCGNSLIGFLKEDNTKEKEWELAKKQLQLDGQSYTQIKARYNKMVNRYKTQSLSFEKLKELKLEIHQFIQAEGLKLNNILANKCNKKNLKYSEVKDIKDKKKVTKKRSVIQADFEELNPFHWDFAFNEIISRGGFDIIITNPPWDKVKIEDKEFFQKYDPSICKKKTTLTKNKITDLLKKPEIQKDYLKINELDIFQRDFFEKFYRHQRGVILKIDGSKKQASSDGDKYRLFTERCFELLNEGGFLGAVIPSGLHKDDGAVGLRREILFKKVRIDGLIDFQNQMEQQRGKIFEGVDSRFKFSLLNIKKGKPKDKFPCMFHQRNLKVLENFPNDEQIQSIKEIKEISPRDCSILEFKNPKDKRILKKATRFPQLGKKLDGLWNPIFYREFDETNDSNLFKNQKTSEQHLPLYKGKAIYQFSFNHDLSHTNRFVNCKSEKVQQGQGTAFNNQCYKDYRLVIRTIAGNTNERSLIATIIPKNCFITNSLHGVYICDKGNRHLYMLLLQSFLNSFVVDYFIRQKISANINKKFITPLHVPRLTQKDAYFETLVKKSAQLTCIGKEFDELAKEVGVEKGGVTDQQKRLTIQGEIDAIVAVIYGLTLEEFEYVLGTFTTGKNQERLNALKKYVLEAFKSRYYTGKVA